MDEPVRVTIVANEVEAEMACGLLRSLGVDCMHRITDMAFGAGGEMPLSGGGSREVLVRGSDLERARAALDDAAGLDDADRDGES